jgi:GTP-binding protein HflX
VEKRIFELREDLHLIERRKEREVASRRDRMTVSLVGYTNAGKSTLLNVLTGASEFTEDRLFATLDTRTRRWQLPGWGPVLLSDTVGFIRDLPHQLIASFKATLEEARQANLLLHVADASNTAVGEQISSVYDVLEEIGIEAKDTILVLNKIDRLDEPHRHALLSRYPNAVAVSAFRRTGLMSLATAVSEALSRDFPDVDVQTSVSNGRLLAFLAEYGEILSQQFDGERVTIHCRIAAKHLARIHEPDTVVKPHASSSQFRPAGFELDSGLPTATPVEHGASSMEDVA